MGDEDAAGFPDLRRHRGLSKQKRVRNRRQEARLCVTDHIAVNATTRGRRRQPDACQDLPAVMHRNPAALGRVILVELHAIDLWQVPFALYDKGLMARP